MTSEVPAQRRLLLDAATIITGIVGRADSPASVILATVRLGGLAACAPDNAIEAGSPPPDGALQRRATQDLPCGDQT